MAGDDNRNINKAMESQAGTIPLMEKVSDGTERTYVYGPTGLIALRVNTTWYYIHKDHLGSVRVLCLHWNMTLAEVYFVEKNERKQEHGTHKTTESKREDDGFTRTAGEQNADRRTGGEISCASECHL